MTGTNPTQIQIARNYGLNKMQTATITTEQPINTTHQQHKLPKVTEIAKSKLQQLNKQHTKPNKSQKPHRQPNQQSKTTKTALHKQTPSPTIKIQSPKRIQSKTSKIAKLTHKQKTKEK